MSFGFGVSDFLAVGELCWKTYKKCKDSPSQYAQLATDVIGLHALLKEVEETVLEQHLTTKEQAKLLLLQRGCEDVLTELNDLLLKYEKMGTKSGRVFDRMGFGNQDISGMRQRLMTGVTLLNAFNSVSSNSRLEKKMNILLLETRAGKREGSVISTQAFAEATRTDRNMWDALCKELEDVGIVPEALSEKRSFIMKWFQEAVAAGRMEEDVPSGEDDDSLLNMGDIASVFSREEPSLSDVQESFERFTVKERKRTDTRVKELEEKVRNLSVLLEQGRSGTSQSTRDVSNHPRAEPDDDNDDEYEEISDEGPDEEENNTHHSIDTSNRPDAGPKGSRSAQIQKSAGNRSMDSPDPQKFSVSGYTDGRKELPNGTSPDVVERGLLDMNQASQLFDRYVQQLSPHYPSVVFPPGASAADARKKQPILFLAVLAASALTADAQLNLKLNQEILQVYATKVALQGQKNLDLVQSILISSLWYYPPERFDQLKFHQYIYMAATMALDLGLGKRPRTRRQQQNPKPALMPDYEPQQMVDVDTMAAPLKPAPDSSAIESRRTLLACYLQCASVSLSLRLPNALRFTSYMGDCLDYMETSPDAAPMDGRFAAWVRLQRIVEDCVNSFSLDDPEGTVSLDDVRVQGLLKGYERQLDEWRKNLKPGVMNSFLEVNYHVNNVFIHEISLHPDHDPEDFRPPFYVAAQLESKIPTNMNAAYENAIMRCFSSAQIVLNKYVSMSVATVQALPALIFVRVIYCCVVLIKLEVSTNAHGSELSNILDRQRLNVPNYLQRCLAQQIAVVGSDGKNILAAKFLMIMKKLIGWYNTYQASLAAGSRQQGPFEPVMAIDPENQRTGPKSQPAPQRQQQPAPQLSALPDFSNQPANAFQPFSNMSPQLSAASPGQQFNNFARPILSPPPPFSPPTQATQQQTHDYHGALLAASANSPGSTTGDYSSPEHYPPTGSNEMSPEPPKMEVDPNMFGQLQNMDQPLTYIPNPNDWMFDGTAMDMMLDNLPQYG